MLSDTSLYNSGNKNSFQVLQQELRTIFNNQTATVLAEMIAEQLKEEKKKKNKPRGRSRESEVQNLKNEANAYMKELNAVSEEMRRRNRNEPPMKKMRGFK